MSNITASDVQNMASIALSNMKAYSKEVGINRAFPYVSDGLKPVNMSLLYALYEEMKKSNRYIKSQTACSSVIGKYHPHGMDAVYLSAVKMAHDRGAPLESGSVLDCRTTDKVTAPRYTEIRLSPLGRELFSTIDITEMVESELGFQMPKTLKARFPYQLFTYNINIGVGMSNNQLPLNPREVMDAFEAAIKSRIKGKEVTTDELLKHIKGPDLYKRSTIYMSEESLRSLIDKGVATCIEVCDIDVIENKGEIHIKELPYREKSPILTDKILKKSNAFHDKLPNVNDRDKIKGIKDTTDAVSDLSGEEDIDIVIQVDVPKYTTDYVLNELYTKTDVKKSHTMMYVMVNEETGELDLYSVKDIFNRCIDVNIDYFRDIYNKELEKLDYENLVNKVLEKLTRPEHVDFIGKTFYKKDKVKLLHEREGLDLTLDEINNIVFKNASILRRLSDRDQILKELEEYEAKRLAILEKLKIENMLKDTENYIKRTLKPLVQDMVRYSNVVFSPLTSVTPKPRKIVIPEKRLVVVDKSDLLYSIPYDEDYSIDKLVQDGARRIYEASENDSLVIITENYHVKVLVKDIIEDKIPLTTFILSDDLRVGKRVIGTFLQKEYGKDITKQNEQETNNTWYFINNKGDIKVVKEGMLYSTTKLTKSTIVEDDEYIVDTYKLDNEEVENTLVLVATKKGMVKMFPINLFGDKNRSSKYSRTIKLDDEDEVVYTELIRKSFVNASAKLAIIDNEGKELSIDLDNTFIKPILNKGVKVSKDGITHAHIETLEKYKVISSLREVNGTEYCTVYM